MCQLLRLWHIRSCGIVLIVSSSYRKCFCPSIIIQECPVKPELLRSEVSINPIARENESNFIVKVTQRIILWFPNIEENYVIIDLFKCSIDACLRNVLFESRFMISFFLSFNLLKDVPGKTTICFYIMQMTLSNVVLLAILRRHGSNFRF